MPKIYIVFAKNIKGKLDKRAPGLLKLFSAAAH